MTEPVFVDTSALYALIDRSDELHSRAAAIFPELLERAKLVTSNYIVLETVVLIQSRLGFEAASLWVRDLLPLLEVIFVEKEHQERALELWLGIGKRKVSLVDCSSFVIMRTLDIEKAFSFDKHFQEYGFKVL